MTKMIFWGYMPPCQWKFARYLFSEVISPLMREILHACRDFFHRCGRFYMIGGRAGEIVSRRETPSQCGRVGSPVLDTADFWLIEKSMFCFHVYVVKKLLTTWTRSGPRFFIAYQTITNIWPQVFNQELVYFIKLKCINICCECLKKIINQLTMYETAFPRTLVFWENDLKWAFPFGKFRKSSETVWSTHVL